MGVADFHLCPEITPMDDLGKPPVTSAQAPHRPVADFAQAPFLILWELTRACALSCKHCRANAIEFRHPSELNTQEAALLLDDISRFGNKPLIVLTGGDPIRRPDLLEIIAESRARGFQVAITPSATPLMDKRTVGKLKAAGISRLAISMDGLDGAMHDSFRGVPGSFQWSNDIIRWANEEGLPLQINTTVCNLNVDCFDEMSDFVARSNAVLWSVFFLVPTGRASTDMQLSAIQCEKILKKMSMLVTGKQTFDVKSTAAPHFRRVLLQYLQQHCLGTGLDQLRSDAKVGALRSYQSVNDGKGLVFISHTGDIFPSGFLPISAGNVRTQSIVQTYREDALFKDLRDVTRLKGKCGRCKFKSVCGGSRARAFADCNDYLAEDKLCAYNPCPTEPPETANEKSATSPIA